MFSQFGSLGYTIMGKTADLTVEKKKIYNQQREPQLYEDFQAKSIQEFG